MNATTVAAVPALSADRIMQLGTWFRASKVLLSAVELGLFTELAREPLDLETLRLRMGLHTRSAQDFFDVLVALGILERRDGIYANTPEAPSTSTGPSRPTSAVSWSSPTLGSSPTGARSPRRSAPGSRRAAPALDGKCSMRSMEIHRDSRRFCAPSSGSVFHLPKPWP
ncbi:MAG: methyltransferase family protein [Vicinamibacteraceae bacterium]